MPEFSVNINLLKEGASRATTAKRKLNIQSYEISMVRFRLFGVTMIPVRLSLKHRSNEIRERARKLSALSLALKDAAKLYKAAEKRVLQYDGSLQNPAFDENGKYGGNQGSPAENVNEMINIVRKYHPDWSRKQIKEYLNTLNSEGCGYVAMANTIFLKYKGREDEFEKTFGFPMYNKNGDLNYNALITDFYTAEDDPNTGGTTATQRENMWEHYCQEHGIKADVRNVNVTVDNYNRMVKKGQIVVSLRPNILYEKTPSGDYRLADDRNSGHSMTITGVTDDGRFIVSSWGETYYLDPDMSVYNGFLEMQQVVYD